MTTFVTPPVSSDRALANRLASSRRLADAADRTPADRAAGTVDYTRTDALSRLVLSVAARPTQWRDLVAFGQTERYWARLDSPADVDIWLLTWLPSQGTELHDHGDSAAAFVIVGGTLAEARVTDGHEILDRHLHHGHVQTVERGVVHDVRNTSNEPAISIHAYSPRLTSMTFYELTTTGLEPNRTVETSEPEL
jgi:mannose-6-phosphate isomerase-like protein (cupin superfamily)